MMHLHGKAKKLDLLGKVICNMFQGLFIYVVLAVLLILDILEKAIYKAFQMLGKLDILGKAMKMLGKLDIVGKATKVLGNFKEKMEDIALQRVAEESVNAGISFYSSGSDMQSLERDLMVLSSRASDIEEEVERAELSGKKRRKTEVKNWLKDVEQVNDEFNGLKRKLHKERPWKHFLSGSVVSKMKDRTSSLTEQSRNFGGLLLNMREENNENNS